MTPAQFSGNDAHKHIFRKQPTKKTSLSCLFIRSRMQQMANARNVYFSFWSNREQ